MCYAAAMVQAIDTVLAEVSDVMASVEFYRAILGVDPEVSTPHWAHFRLGPVKIGLHPPFEGATPKGAGWVVGLRVPDLAAFRAKLATLGIAAGPPHEVPNGLICDFQDPDGNRLQAMQLQ